MLEKLSVLYILLKKKKKKNTNEDVCVIHIFIISYILSTVKFPNLTVGV